MKKLIRNRLSTKCTALLLLMAMLFSVTCVFPFHVYSAASTGTIADGVYTISNNYLVDNYSSYGSFYLRADRLASDAHPTPSIRMSTDENTDVRYRLLKYWKIEHLGSDVYVIRNMANQNQLLGVTEDGKLTLIRMVGDTYSSNVWWRYSGGKLMKDASRCLTARETPVAEPTTYNSAIYHYCTDATVRTAENMSFDWFVFTPASVTGVCWRNEQTGNMVT